MTPLSSRCRALLGVCWLGQSLAQTLPIESDARRLLQDDSRRVDSLIDDQRRMPRGRTPPVAPQDSARHPTGFAGRCLPVTGLRLSGIALLAHSEIPPLSAAAGCLPGDEVNRFIRALTARYIERGYLLARVVPDKVVAGGVLSLRVEEGHLEAIESQDSRLNPATLFPGHLGRPLNIHDLDQGMDQADRLGVGAATLAILPGTTAGGSRLRLSMPAGPRWQAGLSLDNSGRDSTGRWLAGLQASVISPLGLSDYLNLSVRENLDRRASRHSRSQSLFYSLPYGYWTGSVFLSHSSYLNPLKLQSRVLPLSGSVMQGGARLERVVDRDAASVTSASVQFTHKRSRNAAGGALLEVSSPTLSEAGFAVTRLQVVPRGNLTLTLGVDQGLGWFGADRDDQRPDPGLPTARFRKFRADLLANQGFGMAGGVMAWQGVLGAQASHAVLPGVEMLDIADSSAVRGFRANSLAAATGGYWRNTFSARWVTGTVTWQPRIALDAGRVLSRDDVPRWRTLAGAGIGVSLGWRPWSLDLDYARPLHRPAGFRAESHTVLARLSCQF